MIALYRRLAARCTTTNQLNRVHIALDNRMTPLDARAVHAGLMAEPGWRFGLTFLPTKLLARARQRLPGLGGPAGRRAERAYTQRRWTVAQHAMLDRSGKTATEPFRRRRLSAGVALYSAGGDAAAKTLALCFTGSSERMMMPTPVFLQHLDAARVYMVLVLYPKGRGFCAGLGHLGANFDATVDALAALTQARRYARIVTFGTSGGGLAALLAACRLGAAAALSVGGKGPDDPRWRKAFGVDVGVALQGHAERLSSLPRLFHVFGLEHARDRAAAAALAATLPGTLVEVGDPHGTVGHNALLPELRRGRLRALFESTLFA